MEEPSGQTIAVFPGHETIAVIKNDDGSIEIHQPIPNETDVSIILIPRYLVTAFADAVRRATL